MTLIQSLTGAASGVINGPNPVRQAAEAVLSRAAGGDADRLVAELRDLNLSDLETYTAVSHEVARSLPPVDAAWFEAALAAGDFPTAPTAQSREAVSAAGTLKAEGLVTDQDVAFARDRMEERQKLFAVQTRGQAMPQAAADDVFMKAIDARATARLEAGQVNVGDNGRTLQGSEVTAVQRIFGKSIDLAHVTVVTGSNGNLIAAGAFRNGNPAITIGDTIYLNPSSRLVRSGQAQDLSRTAEGIHTLSHEMNHVRQYQQSGVASVFKDAIWQAARYGQNGAYEYFTRERSYRDETLEGQSQIVGDYARYKETGVLPVYAVDGKRQTIGAAALERWATGSGVYGK